MSERQTLTLRLTARAEDAGTLCDLLAARSGLSKARIKDAMNKGAVWLAKGKGAQQRVRRATTPVHVGQRIELHYNAELLARQVPDSTLVADQKHYSVWNKAPGVLAQGTLEGDHCALLRQVELYFKSSRPVFPVHRLDREASGLVLVAHSRDAAARLSHLFQTHQVYKRYRVQVRGRVEAEHGVIDRPLDGKPARTEYALQCYDAERDRSVLDVVIHTGRLHQIRRHFELIDHPVIGDPKYGSGNKSPEGMQLAAVELRFRCPFAQREIVFALP